MIFECTIEALMIGDNDPHNDMHLISLLHQITVTLNQHNFSGWKRTLQERGIMEALRDFSSRYTQSDDYAFTKLRMLLRSLEVETSCVVSSKNTLFFYESKTDEFRSVYFEIFCTGVSTKEGKEI